ncbi:MAG: hypothetical protein JNL08_11310 [Planctomycetes bacterium]|nr:hypothetical protein [Planctomycetota bacterium]
MFAWLHRWLARARPATSPEASIVVADTDGAITATYPDGRQLAVAWQDLTSVEVHTDDSGPWGADVWWVLRDATQACIFPAGAHGEPELLPKLQSLPGFANDELIRAMASTEPAAFLCWRRPPRAD